MKRKLLLVILLTVLSGCQASGAKTSLRDVNGTMPYGKWGFAFFTPHALPATVTRAFILDADGNGETFRTLDSTQEDPTVVGTWNNRTGSGGVQFNKAVSPPIGIMFCWDSIIDKKTYETRIIFPKSMRESMMTSTGKDWRGDTAWNDTLLFGLAPEGKVKIWLQNSGGEENLVIVPNKITTLSGNQLDACKGINQHPNGYVYYGNTPEFIKGKVYPYGNW